MMYLPISSRGKVVQGVLQNVLVVVPAPSVGMFAVLSQTVMTDDAKPPTLRKLHYTAQWCVAHRLVELLADRRGQFLGCGFWGW